MSARVSELVSSRIGQTVANVRAFGDAFYNVMAQPYEANGRGTVEYNDTAIFQKVVDDANAAGRRAVYCPHGTYYVTALTNDSNIIFFGDNATFTGGYVGTINQMGAFSDISEAEFNALKAESVSGWFNVVTGFGADPTGETDSTEEIQAAIDTCYTAGGGVVFLPNGRYLITANIEVKDGVQLLGQGYTTDPMIPGATTFTKDGNFDGIIISGLYAGIDNLTVDSVNDVNGVGVRLIGGRSFIRNVSAINQGGNGFEIGDNIGSRLNLWRAENLLALGNGGDGVYINSTGGVGGLPNANAGLFLGLDSRGNGGDGLRLGATIDNEFHGICCQHNEGYGIHLLNGAEGNYFTKPYTEANTTGEILLDTGAKQNYVIGYRAGLADGITDNGTGNYILGRAQQIAGGPPFFKSPVAYRNLLIENTTAPGYFEFLQNASNHLELLFQGSGATPVRAIMKHNNAGKLILEVQSLDIGGTDPTVPINAIRHKEVALDFPSIPANSTALLTTPLTGITLRDTVIAVPESIPTGLMWNAWVSAADTITLRLANVTTSAIDPPSTPWTFDVIVR